MPQGTVITVRPNLFSKEGSMLESSFEKEETFGAGKLQILEGEFAGEMAFFNKPMDWDDIKEGENVNFNVIGKEEGILKVEVFRA